MADDDKPERQKRSWREIDKGRDRGGPRKSNDDRERDRFQRSTQYTKYKQGLDRLFSGGEMPEELRGKLDPTGENKERDDALKKIRLAEDQKSFAAAVDELLAKYDFPPDAYLLDRALEHPRTEVVLRAMDHLEAMIDAGEFKPPASLKLRLQGLELSADDSDVQERAAALRKKLR